MAETRKRDGWAPHLWAIVVPIVMVSIPMLLYLMLFLPNIVSRWLQGSH